MTRRPISQRRLRPPGLLLAAVAASAVAGLTPRDALAWGRDAHRAAGKLAESRLNPAARDAVKALLEPGETLAEASTWADEVRREMPESGPWHYINVPITEARFSDKFCPEGGCVVRKLVEFRKVLADRNAPRADRRKALRFVAHFVEDMHQPVHVGDKSDRGGNDTQVRFFDDGSNVHRVWDSDLLRHAYPDEEAVLKAIKEAAAEPEAETWASGSVDDWADESFQAAKKAYEDPKTGRTLRPGSKLGDEYQAANLPVARKRLAQSAVRLARVLNEALGSEGSTTPAR